MEDEFQCDVCDYPADTSRGLSIHKSHKHRDSSKKSYECASCGDSFEDYASRRESKGEKNNFCSRECKNNYSSRDSITVECSNCGDDVHVPPSRQSEMGGYELRNVFCDKKCESEWKSDNWVGENHPSYNGGPLSVPCSNCSDEVNIKRSKYISQDNIFCSRDCSGEFQQADLVTRPCSLERCDRPLNKKPHNIKGPRSFCSKDHYKEWLSEKRTGSKNPAWRGGSRYIRDIVTIFTASPSWHTVRKDVRDRDDYKCRLCGNESTNRKLSVHHVIPVMAGGVSEEEILMSLCNYCHKKMENHIREITEPVLKESY